MRAGDYLNSVEVRAKFKERIFERDSHARWAQFFEHAGIEYEYKPQRIPRCDFWLPGAQHSIDVRSWRYDADKNEITDNDRPRLEVPEADIVLTYPSVPDGPNSTYGMGFAKTADGFEPYWFWCECSGCGCVDISHKGLSYLNNNHHPDCSIPVGKMHNTPRLIEACHWTDAILFESIQGRLGFLSRPAFVLNDHIVQIAARIGIPGWYPNIDLDAQDMWIPWRGSGDFILGAIYCMEQNARGEYEDGLPIWAMSIPDESAKYKKRQGLWLVEPWFGWTKNGEGGPSGASFVPTDEGFDVYTSNDNGIAAEGAPIFSVLLNHKYHHLVTERPTVILNSEKDNPLTWWNEKKIIPADTTINDRFYPLATEPALYKSTIFETALHARWAVFFDEAREKYSYQDGKFWLPDMGCWALVTLDGPVHALLLQAQCLAESTSTNTLLLCGFPAITRSKDYDDGYGYHLFDHHYHVEVIVADFNLARYRGYGHWRDFDSLHNFLIANDYNPPAYQDTLDHARILIEMDRDYFLKKCGIEHWRWKYGIRLRELSWAYDTDHRLSLVGHGENCDPDLEQAFGIASTVKLPRVQPDLIYTRRAARPASGGRLYDRILAVADPSAAFKGATIVVADNTAEYVVQHDAVEWNGHSTCKPPFERTFVEIQRTEHPYKAWGLCLWMREVGEQCFVKGSLVYEREDGSLDLEVGISVEIDKEDGHPFNHRILAIGDDPRREYKYFNIKTQAWELKERHIKTAERLLKPLFLALTLMNCHNVVLVDEFPLSVLSRNHERKYHQPLVTYKTIRINPNRSIERLADPVARQETGNYRELPLHIVRGVEADYTQGPGLFGKYHIRVWKPQHVRGDIKNGAVVKDYEIQASKEAK